MARDAVQETVVPVILAGGQGTRLWPLSRPDCPKQFQRLTGDLSLFQQTVLRVAGKPQFQAPIVVASESLRIFVEAQLSEIGVRPGALVLEPVSRNTACAIALAALVAQSEGMGERLLVMPSDHAIGNEEELLRGIDFALAASPLSALVTFGISPRGPATEYGYIRLGSSLYRDGRFENARAHIVSRFVEKPSAESAERIFDSGNYLWNSGIFLFPVDQVLAELRRLKPALLDGCAAALCSGEINGRVVVPSGSGLEEVESISIDYAVMERAELALVIPLDLQWSDLGSWTALWEIDDKDSHGNVTLGDAWLHNVANSYVRSRDTLTTVIGLDDVIVVTEGDAVVVAAKDHAQDVKLVVDGLKRHGRTEAQASRVASRPWGQYEVLIKGSEYQVKRIVVNPEQSLSLQLHHFRSEHWTVVSGEARAIVGDECVLMRPNDSVYIPAGAVHRLSNHGPEPLELIEVQCGSYLGEDDIVRLDDIYGRSAEALPMQPRLLEGAAVPQQP